MPQKDYVLENLTGGPARIELNAIFEAIATNNSDDTEPTDTFPYMWWVDDSTTPPTLKQRNGADNAWVSFGQYDATNIKLSGGQILFVGTAPGSPPTYTAADKLILQGGSGDAVLNLATASNKISGIGMSDATRNQGYLLYDHSTDTMTLGTAGTTRLTVTSTGAVFTPLVTVSNSAPGYLLVETDAAADNQRTSMYGSSAKWRLYFENDAGAGGTPAIEISRSGNTPAAHIYTGTSFTWNGTSYKVSNLGDVTAYNSAHASAQDTLGATFEIANTGNDNSSFAQLVFKQRSSSSGYARIVATGGSSPVLDIVNNAILGMRITDTGRALLGAITAAYSSDSVLQIPVGGATFGAITTEAGSTSARKHLYFRNPNGEVGSISTSASATSYTTSSDYRLKENFEEIGSALEKLCAIPVYEFNFKTSPYDKVMGVKAHELQAVLPFAVMGEKDEIDLETGEAMYQGVDYSKIVPLVIAAIQELYQLVGE